MALVPFRNHWWHVTLYVSAHGLTTGPMPAGDAAVEIELDFVDHRLRVRTSDGRSGRLPAARPAGVRALLRATCSPRSSERRRRRSRSSRGRSTSATARRSPRTPTHDRYDADAVERFWRILRLTDARAGALRLALQRQGEPGPALLAQLRPRPRALLGPPGAARSRAPTPSPPRPTRTRSSRSAGGPATTAARPIPAFYSYTAPEPDGLRDEPLRPTGAEWQDTGNGSLAVLPYDAVRAAARPGRRAARLLRERLPRGRAARGLGRRRAGHRARLTAGPRAGAGYARSSCRRSRPPAPPWRSATSCASSRAASAPSTASTCGSSPARSTASSGPTAPARRRRCGSSRRSFARRVGPRSSPATTSSARPTRSAARSASPSRRRRSTRS